MKIALDAAAGDFGLAPNIEGAVSAANRWGLEVLLVGPGDQIRAELSSRGISAGDKRFEIEQAPSVIAMSEEPAAACRANPRASIMVGARLAAEGRAAGLVSTGNSGATMVAALWHLKRLPSVLRPAIAAPVPTLRGMALLVDAGANVDCKPWHLLQFALMGSEYARHIFKIDRPRIGLLSIGEEEGKGNDLVKETLPLLKCSGLNFSGMIEGRDIPAGAADVIVCDGFVGNVAVKLMEGVGAAVLGKLKGEILGKAVYKLGAMMLRKPFGRLRNMMSYEEYGGAPLLGINGNVIVCHGKSSARAVACALRVARDLAGGSVAQRIRESVAEMKSNLEPSQV